MSHLTRLASIRRNLFARLRVEQDLDDELRAYLDQLTDEKRAAGMPAGEAVRAARSELGGLEQVKEEVRQIRTGQMLNGILQDLRYGARNLRLNPPFTVAAVLALALGIGANTALFSVVNAALLRPLPYPHAGRLAIIWSAWGKERRGPASGPELMYLRQHSRSFEEVAGVWVTSGAITGTTEPEQIRVGLVTSNFLPLLAERPQLGRFFAPDEDRYGNPRRMILTDGLWRRRFGADPKFVGQTVRLGPGNFTVVGVLPPDFKLLFPDGSSVPSNIQVFIPFLDDLEKESRQQGYIRMIGRLRVGVSVAQAQREAESIAGELRAKFKDFAEQDLHLSVMPLQADDMRGVHPALVSLLVAVGLVLLISCANVAILLLSRCGARRREMALRTALGAAKARLVRQLLTESILLGCLGGAAALGVGWAALTWILSLQPEGILRLIDVRLDGAALAFTATLAVVTGILFALAPALSAAREDVIEVLKQGGRTTAGRKEYLRRALVVSEVSLSFLLLVGTGLMIRTFAGLLRMDPGFQPADVITFQIAPPISPSAHNFLRTLRLSLAALPGTKAAGAVSHLPLDEGLPNWYSYYWPEGAPVQQQNTVMADHRSTLPGYFESIGATLLAGREFEDTDDTAHTHVAIVDDALAQQTWPGQDAIGKRLSVEDSPAGVYQFVRDTVVVVGVVRHIQSHSLTGGDRGQIYLPFALAPRPQISFAIKTTAPLPAFAASVRQTVKSLDKDLPVSNLRLEQEYVETARAQTRFVTLLGGALAAIALALACVGIYAVTSFAVAQRTGEIAIRMALGARAGDIRELVLRHGALPVAVGIGAGFLLAAVLTPLLAGLLYGVRPIDPLTFISITVCLSAVGLAACYIPARHAARVDPMSALRQE